MRQVLVKKGRAVCTEVPAPKVDKGSVLVRVGYSCISAGTEISGVKNSGTPLIKRALQQPENLKRVLSMAQDEGILHTLHKVRGKLGAGSPTGYSAAGTVIEVGEGIHEFKAGDRVACAGAGIANHAEYIVVPRNLCINVPDGLGLREASTVALGSIAMQGIRRADLRLGECVAIIGLGILGQLTLQMAKAAGCKAIAIDLDERRLRVAEESGADLTLNPAAVDPVAEAMNFTDQYGVDSVIITAATSSNEPLSQAFRMCRRKGRVVLVGVIGNQFERSEMYQKELDFLISTSYGPGRYDPSYEQDGIDYPYGYVRWTEKRNMQEYLRLLRDRRIVLDRIIEREYAIEDAERAFAELQSEKKPLMVLLRYEESAAASECPERVTPIATSRPAPSGRIKVAVVGAGGFAKGMHLPNLQKLKDDYTIHAIVSHTGSNAKAVAAQYGARYATTDYQRVLDDPDVDLVMICTRHDLHASMAVEAMRRGKAVFVEKPMALNREELRAVEEAWKETGVPYLVGFNRRFSRYALEAKKHLAGRSYPMIINYRMNAGYIPLDHWVHSPQGGGRIIGEACHIFDLFNFFTESELETVTVNSAASGKSNLTCRDNVVATLQYADGSVCTLTYTSLGHKDYPKEFCEIYFDRKVITIDDYKAITGYGVRVDGINTKTSQKGQYEELVNFAECIRKGREAIPFWQLKQATEASFVVDEELRG